MDIMITGDFNLGFLNDWESVEISDFVKKVKDRIENDETIGIETSQAVKLIEFSEKWNLVQLIKEGTRGNRILDLAFTNNVDMFGKITHDRHNNISDHDTLVIKTNYDENHPFYIIFLSNIQQFFRLGPILSCIC